MITKLPDSEDAWNAGALQHGLQAASIHSYQLPSASNVAMQQFYLLRSYWPRTQNIQNFRKAYESRKWIHPEYTKRATEFLENSSSWRAYIKSFGQDFHHRSFEGTFATARYYQHLSSKGKNKVNGALSQPKVYFPRRQTRSMARDAQGSPLAQPRTPPNVNTEDPIAELVSGLADVSIEGTYDPFSTPLFESIARVGQPDDTEVHQAIEDEQIVNTALVLFLNALTLHFIRYDKAEWSLHRKPFHVRDITRSKILEARVDGILRTASGTGAIIEVKPMMRNGGIGPDKIRIQETAQMAAWIASEPPVTDPSSSSGPQLRSNTKSKAAPPQREPHRRLLVSQDRHQIFLTVATFDDHYVHYITGRNDRMQGSFLVMNEYGPFDIGDYASMQNLGGIMLAISLQGGM